MHEYRSGRSRPERCFFIGPLRSVPAALLPCLFSLPPRSCARFLYPRLVPPLLFLVLRLTYPRSFSSSRRAVLFPLQRLLPHIFPCSAFYAVPYAAHPYDCGPFILSFIASAQHFRLQCSVLLALCGRFRPLPAPVATLRLLLRPLDTPAPHPFALVPFRPRPPRHTCPRTPSSRTRRNSSPPPPPASTHPYPSSRGPLNTPAPAPPPPAAPRHIRPAPLRPRNPLLFPSPHIKTII